MKTSQTGKPLCYHKHCRKLATHAVGWYRSHGKVKHLHACETHSQKWNDARRLDMRYSSDAPFLAELPVIEDQAAPSGPLPVIMEDEPLHTSERPTCSDNTCPCHQQVGRSELRLLQMLQDASNETVSRVEQLASEHTQDNVTASLEAIRTLKNLLKGVEQQVRMLAC